MSSPSLSIALLSYRGDPYTGGQGVYLSELSRRLVERGHRVDVLSGRPYPDLADGVGLVQFSNLNLSDRPDGTFFPPLEEMSRASDWLEWVGHRAGVFPEPYTFGRRVVNYLEERSGQYDILHDNQSLSFGLLRLRRMGFPVVASVHHPISVDRDIALRRTENRLHRLGIRLHYSFFYMQRFVARRLPRMITGSRQARRDIVREFDVDPAAVTTVPYGVDTETFRPREEVDRHPRRLMAVGSSRWLQRQIKGLPVLFRAVGLLRDEFPDLEVIVVGAPDRVRGTDVDLMSLGIPDRVAFVEGVSTQELVNLYGRASVAVVPSRYEGFGLPAAEAMACETPVVATDVGGLPEVVGDAGRRVPPDDPPAMAAAIRALLQSPRLRRTLGRKGRRRVRDRFDWDRTAHRTEEVYRDVLKQNPGTAGTS